MNHQKAKKAAKTTPGGWKPAMFAFALSLFIGGALILLASFAANLTSDPGKWVRPLAVLAAALTYLIAGAIAAKFRPDAPLAAGTVNGLVLSALSLVVSLLFRKTASPLPAYASALLHAGMILLSLLGAYLIVLKQKRTPGKKKRKHR